MVLQDEVDPSEDVCRPDENHRGEPDSQVKAEDWADALIIAWENEGNQMDEGGYDNVPNAVMKKMECDLKRAWQVRWNDSHYHNHRPRENHSETVATNRLIQFVTDKVCEQLGV